MMPPRNEVPGSSFWADAVLIGAPTRNGTKNNKVCPTPGSFIAHAIDEIVDFR